MTKGNRQLARIGFRVLLTLTVLWGTVAAAVVFAIRFDLFPSRVAPEIPSPGESVHNLGLPPFAGDSGSSCAEKSSPKTAIVFFDPADAGSSDLVKQLTGDRLPETDTSTHVLALALPGKAPVSKDLASAVIPRRYVSVGRQAAQRLRYLPTAWLIRDGAIQAVIEGFGGAEGLTAAVAEFVETARGSATWPKVAAGNWGAIIPPESALHAATSLQRVQDLLGSVESMANGLMTRVALIWRSADSTCAWQVDLARPNCNCPFDRVDHWDQARVILDPTTGRALDVTLRGALTTAELRDYVPMD